MAVKQRPRLLCLLPILIAGAVWTGGIARADDRTVVSFDAVPNGSLPPQFRLLRSADATPGRWQVERVGGIATLAHLLAGGLGYQLAALESPRLENLRAGLRLRRGIDGDGAAGLAWRIRDGGNYYAARLDFVEREFLLYKFVRGNRISLTQLPNLRLDDSAWHALTVEHDGNQVRVWLNGIPVATERDRSLPEAGMLGLWLPSDSTAYFTDLWYERFDEN